MWRRGGDSTVDPPAPPGQGSSPMKLFRRIRNRLAISAGLLALAGCSSDTPVAAVSEPVVPGYEIAGYEGRFPPLVIPARSPETAYVLRVVMVELPYGNGLAKELASPENRGRLRDYSLYERIVRESPEARFRILPVLSLAPGKPASVEIGVTLQARNGAKKPSEPDADAGERRRIGAFVEALATVASDGVPEVRFRAIHSSMTGFLRFSNGDGSVCLEPICDTEQVSSVLRLPPGSVAVAGHSMKYVKWPSRDGGFSYGRRAYFMLVELDRPFPRQKMPARTWLNVAPTDPAIRNFGEDESWLSVRRPAEEGAPPKTFRR